MLYYDSMGFDVELFRDGQSMGTKSCASNRVFTSISAGGETVSAAERGYRYFSMVTITGIDIIGDSQFYFVVRPFTTVGASKYYGAAAKINITATGFSIDESYVE